MKKLVAIVACLLLIAGLVAMPAVPVSENNTVYAQNPCDADGDPRCTPEETSCQQLQQFDPEACDADSAGSGFSSLARSIANIILFIVGLVSVLAVIIAGLLYTTSGGDPRRTAQAKNTLIYALIGIVVAASAYALVLFVFDEFQPDTTYLPPRIENHEGYGIIHV